MITKIYKKYYNHIFPKIRNIRGTTRVKDILKTLAQSDISKVSEKNIEFIDEKEWDNLVILDAARYDIYKEEINPEAESRITAESHSRGFIRENFSEGDWSDTVVITANPFYNQEEFKKLTGRTPEETFETIFQVWGTDWDEESGSVLPKDMVDVARTAEKLFPDKRKIIHFMQPHYPFLGSDVEDTSFEDALMDEDYTDIWEKAERGLVNQNEVLKAYRNNHAMMEEHIENLSQFLTGRTVVTADHANLIGESGFYGHPGGSDLKPLRKVPWDVI
jgi:hypothetical protein